VRGGVHPDDDRLSALLDGQGSADDEAHVLGCGACKARLATWQDATRLVSTPVEPASPSRRESAVAAALAEVSVGMAEPEHPGLLRLRRRRSARPQAQRKRVLIAAGGAAAAVVLLAASVGLTADHGSQPAKKVAGPEAKEITGGTHRPGNSSSSGASALYPASSAKNAAVGTSGDQASEGSSTSAAVETLGSFDSLDAVVKALKTSLAAPGSAPLPEVQSASERGALKAASPPPECSAAAAVAVIATTTSAAHPDEVYAADLTYAGTPAIVYVFETSSSGRVAVVAQTGDCRVLAQTGF
jgi:hypothetical protein